MKILEIKCDRCCAVLRHGDYTIDYGSAFVGSAIMGNNNFPSGGFDLCGDCFSSVARKLKEIITPA